MRLTPGRAFVIGFVTAAAIAVAVAIADGRESADLVLRIVPDDPAKGVTVYVGGAVSSPGLYTLPSGARVAQAVESAGGPVGGDTAGMPMARELRDAETIIVPEAAPLDTPPEAMTEASPAEPAGQININTASAAELDGLPGIGPAIAARIIAYREENGPFGAVDDLVGVRGISQRMVDEMRDQITTGGPG